MRQFQHRAGADAGPCPHHSAYPALQHPLDLIPWFRRWPVSHPRNFLYTGVWSSLLALPLTVANFVLDHGQHPAWSYLAAMLLIANIIGYLNHITMFASVRLLKGWPRRATGLPRLLFHVATVGACVVLGVGLGNAILNGGAPLALLDHPGVVFETLLIAAGISVFMLLVRAAGDRRVARDTLAARQSEQIAATARLLAEARLRALQAQIEPHFLYNTLANVLSLIGPQPERAHHMLERFIDYLRASLAASRQDQSTLGAEADLIAAYLDVLAVRMGERLRYRIDVAPELRALPIAPMLLQPVVENAISHGLEPKVEGGEVVLSARRDGATLCVQVSDTGVGLDGGTARPRKTGGGVGLSNLRDRLRSLHGDAAQVQLLENQPCGMTVRLLLPLLPLLPLQAS